MTPKTGWPLIIALIAGFLIGWVDSRPTWDDTGVTAVVVLVVSGVFGAIMPDRPWLAAFAVGIWVPLLNIMIHGNYISGFALIVALVGAYAGAYLRKAIAPPGAGT